MKRISGQSLASSIGQEVILLGTVTRKSSNGRSIELKTTDGVMVNVALPEPVDGNLEGYVEIHGTPKSKSTISCSNFVSFPSKLTENFEAKQYNDMLLIMNVIGDKVWSYC